MEQDTSVHGIAGAEATAVDRLLVASLPPGWVRVGRARQGSAAPMAPPSGCHVLASGERGVALLDIVPDATPNAVPRLRRALAHSGFATRHPGVLPVWHGRLEAQQLHLLPTVLAEGFAAQPALNLRSESAGEWIAALQEALDADPGWEASGRAKRPHPSMPVALPPDENDLEDADLPPRRSRAATRRGATGGGRARWGVIGLGLVGVFLLGLTAGVLVSSGDDPAADSASAVGGAATAAPPSDPPAAPLRAAEAPAVTEAVQEAQASGGSATGPGSAAPPMATDTDRAEPATAAATGSALPPAPPPVTADAASPEPPVAAVPSAAVPIALPPPAVLSTEAPGAPERTEAMATGPATAPTAPVTAGPPPPPPPTAGDEDTVYVPIILQAGPADPPDEAPADADPVDRLPLPPARIAATPPQPQPQRRPASAVDRRCADAMFRWSQGRALTASEMALVREGCRATVRR